MGERSYQYLVFEGGGTKGIAYAGALQFLEENMKIDLKGVAGTSAGAISASLIAAGYNGTELEKCLSTLNYNKFLKNSRGFIRDSWRLLSKYGWYSSEAVGEWIGEMFFKKGFPKDVTFQQLYDTNSIKLRLYGTHLESRSSVLFSTKNTPKFPVAQAVRISMAIPLFYESICLTPEYIAKICKDSTVKPGHYVDGGVLINYPIKVWDELDDVKADPLSVLGFRLDSQDEINHSETKISSIVSFIESVIETMHQQVNMSQYSKLDWERTIIINTDNISATQFSLTERDIKFLLSAGHSATQAYFYEKMKETLHR